MLLNTVCYVLLNDHNHFYYSSHDRIDYHIATVSHTERFFINVKAGVDEQRLKSTLKTWDKQIKTLITLKYEK